MDWTLARDILNHHFVSAQPLSAEEVEGIVSTGIAGRGEFAERLSGKWWHESHPAFPEDWTDEDDAAAND